MTRKQILANAMALAKQTQSQYNKLGSPSTQNVRNPYPMHQLIPAVLPTLPAPDATVKVRAYFTIEGTTYNRELTLPVSDLLSASAWKSHGMTVQDIVGELEAKGFVAHESTVRQTLSTLKYWGTVNAVRADKPEHRRGCPQSLYFRPAKV